MIGLLMARSIIFALPEIDLGHEDKMTLCSMLANRRVYSQEKLDVFCTLKVQEWDNQVKCLNVFIALFKSLFYDCCFNEK